MQNLPPIMATNTALAKNPRKRQNLGIGTPMRQLPIITPYGPQPILQQQQQQVPPSRFPLQEANNKNLDLNCPQSRISIQPAPADLLQAATLQYLASNSNRQKLLSSKNSIRQNSDPANEYYHHHQQLQKQQPSHNQNSAQQRPTAKRVSLCSATTTPQTSIDKPQRQLPIITKYGVLRLRDKGTHHVFGEAKLPPSPQLSLKRASIESGNRTKQSNSIVSGKTDDTDNIMHSSLLGGIGKHNRLSNASDFDNEDYAEYTNQYDMDVDENQIMSDEVAGEESDADEERASLKSEIDESEENDEFDEEYIEVNNVDQVEGEENEFDAYEDDGNVGPLEDSTYYLDQTGHPAEIVVDEEAEYFSALATVPEEDGKLSDKDNMQEYEQMDDGGQEDFIENDNNVPIRGNDTPNGNSGGSISNKLPTIVENGFEAQVLEYIAEKAGMRMGELFSVDEEPSSYNDDACSRESEDDSRTANIQQKSSDLAAQSDFIAKRDYDDMNNMPELTILPDDHMDVQPQQLNDARQQQFYGDRQKIVTGNNNYGEFEEEDERILMSPSNVKTSFEQEEYDEQYRDINNMDDLDRRATNHVHAIDGHSKSMLNDIHQQRTIVDYYDEGEYALENNNIRGDDLITGENAHDERNQEHDEIEQHEYGDENFHPEENDKTTYIEPADEGVKEDRDDLGKVNNLLNGFQSNLPRARIRWITAVDKIVNRSGEVSSLLTCVPEIQGPLV